MEKFMRVKLEICGNIQIERVTCQRKKAPSMVSLALNIASFITKEQRT
jgi:hypothetical protein